MTCSPWISRGAADRPQGTARRASQSGPWRSCAAEHPLLSADDAARRRHRERVAEVVGAELGEQAVEPAAQHALVDTGEERELLLVPALVREAEQRVLIGGQPRRPARQARGPEVGGAV